MDLEVSQRFQFTSTPRDDGDLIGLLDVDRLLYRTTITGDVPGGVDGFRSEVVHGEVFTAEVPSVFKQNAGQPEASPVLS